MAEQRRRVVEVAARGPRVLASRSLNRSTAFTHEERAALGLTGLLPGAVSTMEDQLQAGARAVRRAAHRPGASTSILQLLRDRNEVLFYRLLTDHLEECCRSSTPPRSARRSSATATSTAAPAVCTCPSTHPTDRGVAAQLGLGRRRGRPDRGHRRRGHPRHRRLGRRRHRASRSASSPSTPPPAASTRPGDPGRRSTSAPTARAARRPAVPRQPAPAGPRPALRRLHRRVRRGPPRGCSPTPCCTGRTSAPSNARRILRATATAAAPSTTTCRAPARSSSPPRCHAARASGTRCATTGSSSTAPAPPGIGIADQLRRRA